MTQSHLIVKEEGICIYREPEKPILPEVNQFNNPVGYSLACADYDIKYSEYNRALEQSQSSAILCEDQVKALSLIQKLYNLNHVHLGISYPVPGIEFTHEWINPCITEKRCLNADVETCKQNCKKLYIVARLIEHTAEKESPEIDKEEEQKPEDVLIEYLDFDERGFINGLPHKDDILQVMIEYARPIKEENRRLKEELTKLQTSKPAK